MSDKSIIGGVVVLLIAVGTVLFAVSGGTSGGSATGAVDLSAPEAKLAQCLKDSGTIFYGAFWCPHCRSQKEMFGAAQKLLPYVECSTLDGNGQLPVCREKGITGYPTWEFPDGSRLSGEQSFETLAEKSGCAAGDIVPEAVNAEAVPVEGAAPSEQ